MLEKNKKHRLLQHLLKIGIILIISAIIVMLLPKITPFDATYQKGMPWLHETLVAPFDFPIHKTPDELQAEVEKITREYPPIFYHVETVARAQVDRFRDRAGKNYPGSAVANKLQEIYEKGILLLPGELRQEDLRAITVAKNNFAREVDFNQVYTLKNAYSTLVDFINGMNIPREAKKELIDLDLNDYLKPNLVYDKQKTHLSLEARLKEINRTRGIVREGETIIAKKELVSPEKYTILESFKIEQARAVGPARARLLVTISQTILTLIALASFSIFLYFSRKRLFYSNKDFVFLHCMFLLTVLAGIAGYTLELHVLLVPVLFFPVIVNILFGSRAALFLLLGTVLLVAYLAPDSYMYTFMQLAGGIVSIYSLSHLQRRGQLFMAVALVLATYLLVYSAFTLLHRGAFTAADLLALAALTGNALLLCLAYPVLYLFEKLFGYTSEISLVEFSNPNHPLLRLLTKKAPGTFQHSLMVANLAEEAVYHVGGSPLLARTGALYHDIGKTLDPVMFIENQAGGVNPHDSLDFDESARVVIEHVTRGVELARKHNLPEAIINFIRTHHGRSKAKYFYFSYKNKYPDRTIDETAFTYPGPDPGSKECAVVMMADAVEAASRALEVKNEENIAKLVNELITTQLEEGRFNNADITFKDIATVKRVYTEQLVAIYHARVTYPRLEKDAPATTSEAFPPASS
ncbi:MAG: HDIG domain-containing protein [Odoribacteraceae bacterium]|jgi:putative nucleotidyltransferase with HDIG domain|nr:HDIG domain-containing protein [Odoribacteraceae bacterium]